ncbi:MAG: alpha-ribazole phosphatase [Thermodesulfovibrionia bacterium]|nr:alpha-ribazole phosphatase [Thermodesulfovibrionia bacterium]
MLTKLYLIRHGETEGAETKRYKGHIDVPLSANGIEQIKRLAGYLNNSPIPLLSKRGQKKINAVYCSDLSRAVKSAEIIADPYGLKPIIMPELRERNFGLWEGMSFDEIREKWPDAFNAWAANPFEFSPMNGESTIELRDRALKVFSEIIEKHQGENIAIVAHGGINRVILCHLLGIPLENIFRVEQDYGCLNIVEMWDYPVVKCINYVG